MRNASDRPHREGFVCESCGRFIVTALEGLWRNPKTGSPRRFCDAACRQAALRRRRAGVAEDTPRQVTGGRNRRLSTTAREEATAISINARADTAREVDLNDPSTADRVRHNDQQSPAANPDEHWPLGDQASHNNKGGEITGTTP